MIGNTGFVDELGLKIGCKVMLITNVKVQDGLSNGQLGEFKGVVKGPTGEVKMLMVRFALENAGRQWRAENPGITAKYPGCTGIKKILHNYSLTDKSAKNIQLHQFPIMLAHAVTAHKIQGQGIQKPLKVALDVKLTWEAAQAYVMISRVQELNQLFSDLHEK